MRIFRWQGQIEKHAAKGYWRDKYNDRDAKGDETRAREAVEHIKGEGENKIKRKQDIDKPKRGIDNSVSIVPNHRGEDGCAKEEGELYE